MAVGLCEQVERGSPRLRVGPSGGRRKSHERAGFRLDDVVEETSFIGSARHGGQATGARRRAYIPLVPRQDDYRVRLSHFEGPLDLLLYLVRRAEVDVHDIPIHTITDEYLRFLRDIDSIEVDLAAEFLVMAATLVEIKSRTLSPTAGEEDLNGPVDGSGDAADPRHDLVRQLVAYQRFRAATDLLQRIREDYAKRYAVGGRASDEAPAHAAPRNSDGIDSDAPHLADSNALASDLEDLHILDLLEAYERIVSAIDFTRMGDHRVEYDDTPISLHEEDIVDRLGRDPARRMTLQSMFQGRSRGEMLGLFLALLELARQQRVLVKQDAESAIEIELAQPEAALIPGPTPTTAGS